MGPDARLRRKLLAWYQENQRDLPWRRTSDPYCIWLSEIMLQQTRAHAVIPYYHRFLEKFPTAQALAAASEDAVLTAWSGLGYYSRARNLRTARVVLFVMVRSSGEMMMIWRCCKSGCRNLTQKLNRLHPSMARYRCCTASMAIAIANRSLATSRV